MKELTVVAALGVVALCAMYAKISWGPSAKILKQQHQIEVLAERIEKLSTLEQRVEKMETMLKKAGYTDQEYWR